MKSLIQRVTQAQVQVDDSTVGAINRGLLAFVGVERGDDSASVVRMAQRLLTYRVFSDTEGRMNRSLTDVGGDLLLVSQFTLAADTRKGTRPSFSSAADPEEAAVIFGELIACCRESGLRTETGRFGAEMVVSLINDGPVTFLLEC
ncbi:D-tyrosyl-tRNA(Tyr) deacylase [Luminiphilus syltensis NOR5-1B]|uniref:D-aminoacyl-tRNA deacylase n=1 Tax=Luminiphilus syltensis NOR5-1B TaxID=565045 RepID=B8KWQ6_9GAMM|nr:D-aminoacyl-tRNA deacylase [Luminiphilus syltensis]EED35082.1 D-tyrosyl-tRNA(Tyr) deacylase [Luminiphilus syltensis NOR5-1B]